MRDLPPQFINCHNKIPFDPTTGFPINPHDPRYWRSYDDAVATGHPVGFVLTANDPFCFIDMDKCRVGDTWSPQALAILAEFPGAAVEVSGSGSGLHVMGRCDPSVDWSAYRNKWDGWLEFYTSGRFVAFGPWGWQGSAQADMTPGLRRTLQLRPAAPALLPAAGTCPVPLESVLERMLRARSANATFGTAASPADLWRADPTVLGRFYPSPGRDAFDRSSADAALLGHLAFWTCRDPAAMDVLFRQSGLYRPKWERDDYRASSIGHAISVTTSTADWRVPVSGEILPPGTTAGNTAGLATITDQQQLFAGCVYVTDQHAILIPTGEILRPEQFDVRFGGREFLMQHDGAKPTRKAFEAFTVNRAHQFPKARTTTFRPDLPFAAIVNDAVNTYRPADVAREPGDVTPFLDHVRRLIPNDTDRRMLVTYMAACVQQPGVKFQWAPVIQGTPGNGKSFLIECMVQAIGSDYVHLPRPEELAEKFNDYVVGKLFIGVDEVHMRGRREMLDVLKPLITNRRTEVRSMRTSKRMYDSCANWLFCTNYKDAIIKDRDDRRFAVVYCAQQTVADLARDGMTGDYFPRLYAWARSGGFARVTHYLRTLPEGALPLEPRAPETSSTAEAIGASMGAQEQTILDAIESARIGFRGGWVSAWAVRQVLMENRMNHAPRTIARVMENLGYQFMMRAPSEIIHEDMTRPRLYGQPGIISDFTRYMVAQGYR